MHSGKTIAFSIMFQVNLNNICLYKNSNKFILITLIKKSIPMDQKLFWSIEVFRKTMEEERIQSSIFCPHLESTYIPSLVLEPISLEFQHRRPAKTPRLVGNQQSLDFWAFHSQLAIVELKPLSHSNMYIHTLTQTYIHIYIHSHMILWDHQIINSPVGQLIIK